MTATSSNRAHRQLPGREHGSSSTETAANDSRCWFRDLPTLIEYCSRSRTRRACAGSSCSVSLRHQASPYSQLQNKLPQSLPPVRCPRHHLELIQQSLRLRSKPLAHRLAQLHLLQRAAPSSAARSSSRSLSLTPRYLCCHLLVFPHKRIHIPRPILHAPRILDVEVVPPRLDLLDGNLPGLVRLLALLPPLTLGLELLDPAWASSSSSS